MPLYVTVECVYLLIILCIAQNILVLNPFDSWKRLLQSKWYLFAGWLLIMTSARFFRIDPRLQLLLQCLEIREILAGCFRKSEVPTFWHVLFIFLFTNLLDATSENCLQSLLSRLGRSLVSQNSNSYTQLIISLITLGLLISLDKLIWRKYRRNVRKLEWNQIRYMIGILMADLGIEFSIWMLYEESLSDVGISFFRFMNPLICLIFYLQFSFLIPAIFAMNAYQERVKISEYYLGKMNEQYLYLETRERETRKFRHDMKEHLAMLEYFLQRGDSVSGQKYLETLTGKVESFGSSVHLNNGMAETVVNRYALKAKENGINLVARGSFPMDCRISPFDICTILSNLLANAVEASTLCGGKGIRMNIRHDDHTIYIQIQNPCNKEMRIQGGEMWDALPESSKSDRDSHGYGMDNVRDAVERYDGWMQFEAADGIFCVWLNLNNIDPEGGKKKCVQE